MSPQRYQIEIPDWVPTSLNAMAGHWSRRHKAKRADRDRVARECDLARVPRVAIPPSILRQMRRNGLDPVVLEAPRPIRRRLEVLVYLGERRDPEGRFRKGGQLLDPDNLNKSLRDALVEAGVLVDDSPDWLDGVEPRVLPDDGKGPRTVLIIEDQP